MKRNRGEIISERNNGGFTLIEMMIVIAVISILAGIVITGVSGFQAGARDTRRIGDMKNTQNLLELYYNKVGLYPVAGDWDTMTGLLDDVNITNYPKAQALPAYPYDYESADGLRYVLSAKLEGDNAILDDDLDDETGILCGETETEFYYCTN